MMPIDALKAYKEQLAAGFTEDQATASISAIHAAIQNVATKEDLANSISLIRQEMVQGFESLRKEIKLDIQSAINELRINTEMSINGLKGYALRWFTIIILLNICIPIIFILWSIAAKKWGY